MKQKITIQVISNGTDEIVDRIEFTSDEPGKAMDQAQEYFHQMQATGRYGAVEGRLSRLQMVDESEAYNAEQVKKLDIVDRAQDRSFGLHMIDVIAAYNKKHFSKTQVQSIFSNPGYVAIVLGFLTGGLESTRDAVAMIGPQLYPADFVNQILSAMDEQIAKTAPEPEQPKVVQPEPPQPQTGYEPGEGGTNVQTAPETAPEDPNTGPTAMGANQTPTDEESSSNAS